MSLMIDEAREQNGRRLWIGISLTVIGVLAVVAFFVGRAQAQEAKPQSPPSHASAAIDDPEGTHHATQ